MHKRYKVRQISQCEYVSNRENRERFNSCSMSSPVILGSKAGRGYASRPLLLLLSPWTACQPAGFLTATANVPTAATIPNPVPVWTANGTTGASDESAADHDGSATSYDGAATDSDGTATNVNGTAIHSAGSVSVSRTEVLVTAAAVRTGT